MPTSLVTGGCGFVGRTLVDRLAIQGDKVICFDRSPSHPSMLVNRSNVRFVVGDVCDPGAILRAARDVDFVYHLAGVVAPRSLEHARRVNVEGTRTLVAAMAAQTHPPVCIFVSSLAAAGPNSAEVTETGPCRPVSHYGRSKLEAETACYDYASRLPVTIVRPPCVFGTGDRNLLSLFKSVDRGWNFVVSTTFRYSFLHVDDLVTGLLAAANSGARLQSVKDTQRRGLYYLADPQPVTFVELAEMIAQSLHRSRVRHVRIPRPVCWLAGAVGELTMRVAGRSVFVNLDKIREALGGSWICDSARAADELLFAPAADISTRIVQTKAYYESVGWLKTTA